MSDTLNQVSAQSTEIIKNTGANLVDFFTHLFARERFASHLLERSFNQPLGWIELGTCIALMVLTYWLSGYLIGRRAQKPTKWAALSHIGRRVLWPLMLLAKLCVAALLGMLSFTRPEHGALLCGVVLIDGLLMLVPRWALFRNLRPHVQNWLMLPALFCSGLIFSLWLAQGISDFGSHITYLALPLTAASSPGPPTSTSRRSSAFRRRAILAR